jgi:hypothetical protein
MSETPILDLELDPPPTRFRDHPWVVYLLGVIFAIVLLVYFPGGLDL